MTMDIAHKAKDAVERMARLILAADGAALAAMLTPDFVGVGYAGQRVDAGVYAGLHADSGSAEGRFVRFDVSDLKVRAAGTAVLVYGVQRVVARVDLTSRFVQLWRIEGGDWQLAYHQETPILTTGSDSSPAEDANR